jgi:hypothetical protein
VAIGEGRVGWVESEIIARYVSMSALLTIVLLWASLNFLFAALLIWRRMYPRPRGSNRLIGVRMIDHPCIN